MRKLVGAGLLVVALVASACEGEAGPEGERGPQGDPGAQGQKGDQGQTGDRGERGQAGEVGETGLQGVQGVQGPKWTRANYYTVENASGVRDPFVRCDSAAHLLVAGGCYNGGGTAYVTQSIPLDVEDESRAVGWQCSFAGTGLGRAFVVCLNTD